MLINVLQYLDMQVGGPVPFNLIKVYNLLQSISKDD